MKSLNELLREIREDEIEMLYNDEYFKNLILEDIEDWLEEETEKQDYIETKFRNK